MKKITVPPGIKPDAAIFLVGSEFLLVGKSDQGIRQKYLSPGSVRHAFGSEPVDSGWLPRGAQRWGWGPKGNWVLTWHPPAIYSAWLPSRKQTVRVPMPALAFFGQDNSYYLWAMKGGKFDPKAQLFNAPCANVSGLGLICWGQNARPDVSAGRFDETWRLFWDAPFSGSHAAGKSRQFTNANERLANLAKSKSVKYPEDDLTPVEHRLFPNPCTLDAAIDRLTKRGGSEWD